MVEVPERGTDEKMLLTLWLIWAAMLGSLLIYVFVCHQFGEKTPQTGSPDFPIGLLKSIFYVVVIVTLFLTNFLRKLMLAGRFGGSESKRSEPGAGSNQLSLLAKYTTATIVSLALSESIGIYGVVLFLLGDSFRTLYIFIGISAVVMFFYRPKREDLEALAIAMQRKGA